MNISWMDSQQRPKITQIITPLVNRLSAKYDLEKVKQKAARVISKENLGEVFKMCIWVPSVPFEFSHVPNHLFHLYITPSDQYIEIQQSLAL